MLMGEAGARKSSAINIVEKLARKVGYDRFAADRLSKEMFLHSMMPKKEGSRITLDEEDIDLEFLLDSTLPEEVSDIYAVADEFLDLVGPANQEFLTMLGKLWDNRAKYEHPKLHGKDVVVVKPTVNLLAGNTPTGFSLTCPPDVVGQGFMSRLLLVFSEPGSSKYYLPRRPKEEYETGILTTLKTIIKEVKGEAIITKEAHEAMKSIYHNYPPIPDFTFKHYNGRRYTHMLKVAMTLAAMDLSIEVQGRHILEANTILHFAENRMPKALGEFGRGKNNATQSDIMVILSSSPTPIPIRTLWKQVGKDLTKPQELTEIMKSLIFAGKIKAVEPEGFVAINKVRDEWGDGLILSDYLELEEME
jgi:hypothetical protein